MKQSGKTFKRWFYNEVPSEDVRTRLFLIVSFSIALTGLFGVFLNLGLGLDKVLAIYCFIVFTLSFSAFSWVRKRRKSNSTIGIGLAFLVIGFLILFWPLNAGYQGPILIYFLGVPVYLAYFLNRRKYYLVIAIIYSSVILMLIYYYFNPLKVVYYDHPLTQLIDVILSLITAGLVLGEFSIYFVEQNDKIRNEIEEKNKLINLQYLGLKEIDEYKNNVFASLSHDLRGPINNAKSIFEILIDDQVSKEEKETFVRLATLQMEETSNLVENILLWAKSQMGGINPVKEEFSVNVEINRVLGNLRSIAKSKQIFIQFAEDGNLLAFGDKSLFTIVLRNLINNAIKFSSSGTVITVITQKSLITKEISISVKDQGVGLTQEELERIFTSGKSTIGTHKETGTGIGLKLSKIFTEINSGKISVASEKGVGSIFTFTIPLKT
jgi:signal transduction histidine kinase